MPSSPLKKRRRREPDPLDIPEANDLVDLLLKQVKSPDDITGRGGLLQALQAKLINRALEAEMSAYLGHESGQKPAGDQPNRRNGRTSKKLRASNGNVQICMPRDREGSFKPHLIPKHSRVLGKFGDTIVSLYARGMSQRDIARFMDESYGVDVDRDVISRATEAVWEACRYGKSVPWKEPISPCGSMRLSSKHVKMERSKTELRILQLASTLKAAKRC